MRVGLFLHEVKPEFDLEKTIHLVGNEIVGFSSPYPIPYLSNKLKFFPTPMELLVCCDLVIIFSNHLFFNDIPRFALRRGVNVFFANLNSYTTEFLEEANQLAAEIGAKVGFGNSGFKIFEKNTETSYPHSIFFAELKRTVPSNAGFKQLQEIIVFDISTIFRSFSAKVKKMRATTMPVQTEDFNLINILLEFDNGSTLTYTAHRLSNDNDFSAFFLETTQNKPLLLSNQNQSFNEQTTLSAIPFIEALRKNEDFEFGIWEAIRVTKIFREATFQSVGCH
jgi:hypothetical protein